MLVKLVINCYTDLERERGWLVSRITDWTDNVGLTCVYENWINSSEVKGRELGQINSQEVNKIWLISLTTDRVVFNFYYCSWSMMATLLLLSHRAGQYGTL